MAVTGDLGPGSRAKALDAMEARASSTSWWSAAGWSAPARPWTRSPADCGTALVEQRDFASGTSSRSSKLVHGGLRYLEMLDFGLVREALQERGLLLTTLAPHLVRPVPFLYPLHHTWERPYVGAGPAAVRRHGRGGSARSYDMGVPRHRHLIRRGLRPARAGPAHRGPDRRDPLLRLPGRRRAPGVDDRAHRCRSRRAHGLAHQGDRLPARGGAGGRRPGRGPRERPRDRGACPGRDQRRRRVDQRGPGDARRPGCPRRGGQQGGAPRRAPRPDPQRVRASSPAPRPRCCS